MIDIELLAAQLGFETQEVVMLLEMFLETSQATMQELKTAIETLSYDEIREHAHSIKGSAANLTLEAIYLKAKEIEDAAKLEKEIAYETLYYELKEMLMAISLPEVM